MDLDHDQTALDVHLCCHLQQPGNHRSLRENEGKKVLIARVAQNLALKTSPDLKQRLQRKFTEIIVDEFQDINHLDFALVQLLSEQSALVATGDDDQAIYGFRGCSPYYIINLQHSIGREVTPFELSINYRNPANLVRHANQLIRYNVNRIPKRPIAARSDRAEIKVVGTVSAGLEAKFIVSFIRKVRRANNNLPFKDLAVLYRTNAQSLPLQVEFILNDLPYFLSISNSEEVELSCSSCSHSSQVTP